MTQPLTGTNSQPAGISTSFATHAPSIAWERVVVVHTPEIFVWAWFRPPHLPRGVIFRLGPEIWQTNSTARPLTVRQLLTSIDVAPADIAGWSCYGMYADAMGGNSPMLDQPVPPPPPGIEPDLAVVIGAASTRTEEPVFQSVPANLDQTNCGNLFEAIDCDWKVTEHLERQMVATRKQLAAMINRLTGLNRDLTPEENAVADRLDKSEWQDARRWLRDGASALSRCIKQHDVGETSNAGKRDWFRDVYEQSVVPRKPFDTLQQVQREFEMYRKRCQMQLSSMLTALSDATSEGERRATTLLTRLAAKMRQARTKRSR